MKDLHDLNLRGNLPKFIENFLKNRSFHVKVGSTLSDPFNQEEGVPQGSILSPLLFEIKINSITKTLKPDINGSLYVDDFLICYKSKGKIETIDRQLQQQLKALEKWTNENGFKFSPTKTVTVHFCRKTSCIKQPELHLYGIQLPFKEETRFLGVIFDRKLSFISHIIDLKTRCKKILNVLKIFSNPEWGGDTETLLHLYRSLIRSKLDYASPIYGSARPSYLKMLDPVQNQGLRLALGAYRTSPVPSLQAEAYEPPLHLRRKQLSLQYAVKLSSNPQNPAYSSVFEIDTQTKEIYKKKTKDIKPFGLRIENDLQQLKFSEKSTNIFMVPDVPFWQITKPQIDLSLTKFKKDKTPPDTFMEEYEDLLKNYPSHETVFTDGSKNKNSVGLAAVHLSEKDPTEIIQRLPPEASIFSAEIGALEEALKLIKYSPEINFLILTDSLSSLQALEQTNPSDTRILGLKLNIQLITQKGKNLTFCWIPSHIGIKGNERADSLAKEALNAQTQKGRTPKLPYLDFRPKIKEHIHSLWREEWKTETENKLFKIRPK